jgi:hypothetical protein
VEGKVYKFRKPVRFNFVDFTDRATRETDCRCEVELNRRLAPDVYLSIADIVMDGVAIEHMVVMRALPDDCRLATMVRTGVDVDSYRSADPPVGAPQRSHPSLRRCITLVEPLSNAVLVRACPAPPSAVRDVHCEAGDGHVLFPPRLYVPFF